MKKILASALIFMSFNALATSMVFNINLNGSDIYKVNSDRIEGDFSRISGAVAFTIKADGTQQSNSVAIPLTQAPNETRLEIAGKNRVRIIDESQGVDAVVPAKIKKSLGGKLKSLNISSQNYLMAMKPVLERQGLDMIQGFNVSTDEFSISMDLNASDLDCAINDTKDLECKSSIQLNIALEAE